METKRGFGRIVMVLAGLVAGIVLLALFVANRQTPTHNEASLFVPSVTVIEAQPVPFLIEARGYGIARPAETWHAVATVGGTVIERHPELESGTLLPAGTVLLALDPSRYALAIAAAEAELAGLAAEQEQLNTEEENTRLLLVLERERLSLVERELARIETLAGSGAVSQSQFDEQQRAVLVQRQAVVNLENQQRLIPSRRQRLETQIDRAATQLGQARRDLADTRFVAPYELRIGEVEVALHQQVSAGQRLFQADSIEAAEIEAQIPLTMLRRLMSAVPHPQRVEDALDIGELFDFSAIRAEVALVGVDGANWPGRVDRVASGLDPRTRMARVVIVVDQPYRSVDPPQRPIPQRDMYVGVRLSADSPQPLLVVPASAVHHGEVYLVDDQELLQRRRVEVAFDQRDLAVIAGGLAPGERVIVDDPVPPLGGMKVVPHLDEERGRALQRIAAGESP
ncbi:MAG: efflux transporter periplasmic adaptor subunit [Desulfofustis sp.]|nr:efflux transporter periplasmic adaptor subunit [Desulfofustis sp.]